MTSNQPFRFFDLPDDVLPITIQSLHDFGSTLRGRELGEIKMALMTIYRNKALYDLYCKFLKKNVSGIDALSPFDSLGWNVYDKNPIESEVFRLNSCIELDSEATLEIRRSFSQLLQFIIRHASNNLKVIRLPFIPGEQVNILKCLLDNCPNLREIHVTDRPGSKISKYIALLVRNSTHLKKFACRFPDQSVLRALSTCDMRLKSLKISTFQCKHLNAFMDAVETHRLSLQSLEISRMGYKSVPDGTYVNSSQIALQVDAMLNYFLTQDNGVQLPVLNNLKFATLGFDPSHLREEFCLQNEANMRTRYEQRARVETDIYGNGTVRHGVISVRDLRMKDFILAFDTLSKAMEQQWDPLQDQDIPLFDANVFHDNQMDIVDLFQEEQDIEQSISDDDDVGDILVEPDFGNLNINDWTKIFCTPQNYGNLRSVTIDVNLAIAMFYRSTTFRVRLRDIWKQARSTLKYLDCNDHWMDPGSITYTRLCRFIRCCVFYCRSITHVRLPSLLAEDMHIYEGVATEKHSSLRDVLALLGAVEYLQISVPFEGVYGRNRNTNPYVMRICSFLYNWPEFLNQIGVHNKKIRYISFAIQNADPPKISGDIRDAVKVAVRGTQDFERKHKHVDLQEVKQLFDNWYMRCQRASGGASQHTQG
ncbi:hypothetical protein BWQ96_05260 [Gracilariopsis chorda]|uniref:Uncharacterized protein n=1 Tax=Gracilariopsis chorda TaxID=448386 RepID=A0A2V3IV00_9FLOR|nr:hypothetical protein BWQ96_05260 [Gracilariopsis chorda]|eukprot:PXF44960.1 hypothetical protein BWQ96_05260 [Gracilariopsis chorda]